MILLALLLASIGTADLVRPQDAAATRGDIVRSMAAGLAVLVLGVSGIGLAR